MVDCRNVWLVHKTENNQWQGVENSQECNSGRTESFCKPFTKMMVEIIVSLNIPETSAENGKNNEQADTKTQEARKSKGGQISRQCTWEKQYETVNGDPHSLSSIGVAEPVRRIGTEGLKGVRHDVLEHDTVAYQKPEITQQITN